jgi:plasmid stability protein
MAELLLRGLDDKLKRALRLRAAENGRSMAEEVREILRRALSLPSPEAEQMKELYELDRKARQRER